MFDEISVCTPSVNYMVGRCPANWISVDPMLARLAYNLARMFAFGPCNTVVTTHRIACIRIIRDHYDCSLVEARNAIDMVWTHIKLMGHDQFLIWYESAMQ